MPLLGKTVSKTIMGKPTFYCCPEIKRFDIAYKQLESSAFLDLLSSYKIFVGKVLIIEYKNLEILNWSLYRKAQNIHWTIAGLELNKW